jgi:uncharacterized protein (TIGR03437 family)
MRVRALLLFLAPGIAAWGQPFLFNGYATSAATYTPPQLPTGGIAQGSIFTLLGRGLGPAAGVTSAAYPLGTALSGVSITVAQGQSTVDALPIFVSSGQVNAIMPSNAPVGNVLIALTYTGQKSNLITARVVKNQPGVFSISSSGMGLGVVQNISSAGQAVVNTTSVAAKPGQPIVIWLTGLGPISAADNQAPPVGSLPYAIDVLVAGKPVSALAYAGRAPCCSGLDQINLTLPQDVPLGCYVPLMVRSGGAVSNSVSIAITPDGGPCDDSAFSFLLPPSLKGQKMGVIYLTRRKTAYDSNVGLSNLVETVFDSAVAGYAKSQMADLFYDPSTSLPPPGACSTGTWGGNLNSGAALPGGNYAFLAGGAVTVKSAQSSANLTLINNPAFSVQTGLLGQSNVPGSANVAPFFLDPGPVTITAPAGSSVGPINATVNITQLVTWTNRNSINVVSLASGATLQFATTGQAQIVVHGTQYDSLADATAYFTCTAPVGAASFAIPAYALAHFPATRPGLMTSRGRITVSSTSLSPSPLQATGLDVGFVNSEYADGKTVQFK